MYLQLDPTFNQKVGVLPGQKKEKNILIQWFDVPALQSVQFVHGSRLTNARVDESVTKLSDSG